MRRRRCDLQIGVRVKVSGARWKPRPQHGIFRPNYTVKPLLAPLFLLSHTNFLSHFPSLSITTTSTTIPTTNITTIPTTRKKTFNCRSWDEVLSRYQIKSTKGYTVRWEADGVLEQLSVTDLDEMLA